MIAIFIASPYLNCGVRQLAAGIQEQTPRLHNFYYCFFVLCSTFAARNFSLKLYFKESERQKGITGTNLLVLMERRLDNTVYRLGFANSRAQARQLVRHNHFLVNGNRVNIPSYLLYVGDVITVHEGSRQLGVINEALEALPRRGLLPWLELDKSKYAGVFKSHPTHDEMNLPVHERLVVELYSK